MEIHLPEEKLLRIRYIGTGSMAYKTQSYQEGNSILSKHTSTCHQGCAAREDICFKDVPKVNYFIRLNLDFLSDLY